MKLQLVSLHVNDPQEAFTFYTEVLGFQERLYMPEYSLAIVVSPEDPEGTGLLLEPSDNPIAKSYQEGLYSVGLPAIVFSVPDLHAEYERLSTRGVVFRKPPTQSEGGLETVFDDTCGNLIQLYQA
jgi:predicted enzyme related to lactoylglutathione lyase